MKRILILSALLMSFAASAGYKAPPWNVYVNLGSRYAMGTMGDARNSADSVQYIGCWVTAYPTSAVAQCEARDAQGNTFQCETSAAPIIALVQGMSDGPFIWFQADTYGTCTLVQIRHDSYFRPLTL